MKKGLQDQLNLFRSEKKAAKVQKAIGKFRLGSSTPPKPKKEAAKPARPKKAKAKAKAKKQRDLAAGFLKKNADHFEDAREEREEENRRISAEVLAHKAAELLAHEADLERATIENLPLRQLRAQAKNTATNAGQIARDALARREESDDDRWNAAEKLRKERAKIKHDAEKSSPNRDAAELTDAQLTKRYRKYALDEFARSKGSAAETSADDPGEIAQVAMIEIVRRLVARGTPGATAMTRGQALANFTRPAKDRAKEARQKKATKQRYKVQGFSDGEWSDVDSETYATKGQAEGAAKKWLTARPHMPLMAVRAEGGAPPPKPKPKPLGTAKPAETASDPSDYQDRKDARIERMRARADTKETEATGLRETNRALTDVMAGTPILVGHHSEKRHRRDLDKMHNRERKVIDLHEEAETLRRRADSAERSSAVSQDDPEAVTKLREKIAEKEKTRDELKAANKKIRAAVKAAKKKHGLSWKPTAIAQLVKGGMTASIAADAVEEDYAGRIGIPAYVLTNASSEIRRTKKRLADLEAKETAEPVEERTLHGVTIAEEDNRLRLYFPDKPSDDIRKRLKGAGFRWSPAAGAWQRFPSSGATYKANLIVAKYGAERKPAMSMHDRDQEAIHRASKKKTQPENPEPGQVWGASGTLLPSAAPPPAAEPKPWASPPQERTPEGVEFSTDHFEVFAYSKGTRYGGLDFEVRIRNGQVMSQFHTMKEAKSAARALEKRYPKPGMWFRVPTSAYGSSKSQPAQVVRVSSEHATFKLSAPGLAGDGREFSLPIATVVDEGRTMKGAPKAPKAKAKAFERKWPPSVARPFAGSNNALSKADAAKNRQWGEDSDAMYAGAQTKADRDWYAAYMKKRRAEDWRGDRVQHSIAKLKKGLAFVRRKKSFRTTFGLYKMGIEPARDFDEEMGDARGLAYQIRSMERENAKPAGAKKARAEIHKQHAAFIKAEGEHAFHETTNKNELEPAAYAAWQKRYDHYTKQRKALEQAEHAHEYRKAKTPIPKWTIKKPPKGGRKLNKSSQRTALVKKLNQINGEYHHADSLITKGRPLYELSKAEKDAQARNFADATKKRNAWQAEMVKLEKSPGAE